MTKVVLCNLIILFASVSFAYGQIYFQYDQSGSLLQDSVIGNHQPALNISGDTSPILSDQNTPTYSVQNVSSSQYIWEVIGGQIISGDSTHEVFVQWDSIGPNVIRIQETPQTGCPTEWVALIIKPRFIQKIPVEAGWNLISTSMDLPDSSILSAMDNLGSNLIQVKDEFGNFVLGQPPQFNTLNHLTDGQGYWVRVTNDDTLKIVGYFHEPTKVKIPLAESPSWNLIGYTGHVALSVDSAFQSIFSDIEQIKTIDESFDPLLPPHLNSLSEIKPGQGYWIRTSQDQDFYYPSSAGPLHHAAALQIENPTGWTRRAYTNSMTFYAHAWMDGEPIQGEGWIGAFVDEECRAAAPVEQFEDSTFLSMVINGEALEEVNFKLWVDGEIIQSDSTTILRPGEQLSKIAYLPFGSGMSSIQEQMVNKLRVTPNPTTGIVNIRVPNEIGGSRFEVFICDMSGKILHHIKSKDIIMHDLSFNINFGGLNLYNGQYLLKIRSESLVFSQQIILKQ